MTSRERWTIYPLLLLALGASLRGKIVSTLEAPQIKTRQIELVNADGKPRLRFGVSQQDAGVLEIYDPKGRVVAILAADSKTGCGQLVLTAGDGKAQVLLGSDGVAGFIETATTRGAKQVLIHSESDGGAVITFDRNRATIVELSAQAGPSGVAVEKAQKSNEKEQAPPTTPD
jgi:hypothetical protein